MNRSFRRLAEGVYDMDALAFRTTALAWSVEAGTRNCQIDRARLIGVALEPRQDPRPNLLLQEPALLPTAILMHPLIPFVLEGQPGLAGRRVLITAGARDAICPSAAARCLHGYSERQCAAATLVFESGEHEL